MSTASTITPSPTISPNRHAAQNSALFRFPIGARSTTCKRASARLARCRVLAPARSGAFSPGKALPAVRSPKEEEDAPDRASIISSSHGGAATGSTMLSHSRPGPGGTITNPPSALRSSPGPKRRQRTPSMCRKNKWTPPHGVIAVSVVGTSAEQQRIVAKIHSLSAKSVRVRDQLDHIPRLVEKYKQAILVTAFRGQLTREWRELQPPNESVDELISRTVEPSQSKGGREATKDVKPGMAGLSVNDPGTGAPKGWKWVRLRRIARQETGLSIFRSPQIQPGDVPGHVAAAS